MTEPDGIVKLMIKLGTTWKQGAGVEVGYKAACICNAR